jgi:DNA-binding SARP family transcriptional activator
VLPRRIVLAPVTAGLALAFATMSFVVVNDTAGVPSRVQQRPADIALAAALAAFLVVGGLLARQRPRHPVAWLLIGEGLVWELGLFCAGYVNHAVYTAPGSLPAADVADWILGWIWVPGVIGVPVLLLLFPDGRPPSRRWRPVGWLALAAGPLLLVPPLAPIGGVLLPPAILGALASLVARYRRSGALERRRIGWFAYAGVLIALALAVAAALDAAGVPETVTSYLNVLPLAALPLAVGVALTRHKLYDLETLVDRTLVAAVLAGFVTLVYFVVIVAAGTVVGGPVATAIVAIAIQPLRGRVQRVTARVGYHEPEPAAAVPLAVKTLGGFRVFRDGEPLAPADWQSKKARTLFKILLARRGRPVTREQLMEHLWPGDDPAKLNNRLSVALTALRTVLGRELEVIRADGDAVSLDLCLVAVDVERFLDEVEQGLADRDLARLHHAERLYAGDFLEEDPYDDWALDLREQAREAYASALRMRGRLATDDEEAVRAYLRLLEHDRWDAGAHRELIARLDRAGRHGEATRRRRAYVRRMGEIGIRIETNVA